VHSPRLAAGNLQFVNERINMPPIRRNLDEIFHPRNVAVIGASPTNFYTIALMQGNLRDNLYLVNPNYSEIHGRRSYATILDIEELVDYVILALPAQYVLDTVKACVRKGVKAIQSFTSGFGETGLEAGIQMERELAAAVRGKVRFIGPNCMGIYCPRSGLSFNPASTHEQGRIGVITQSGTFAQFFIHAGKPRNVKISKMVSYGNGVDLDCPDFLEYLADDPDTKVIALYVEGTRDGRRLMSALEYACRKKPVIALKGGVTREGGRVAASHTGALAGRGEMWSTLFKQAGALQVDDFEDLLNLTVALDGPPLPAGNGVSIITYSGGFSVVQSDMCVKAGLAVPQFSPQAVGSLREFVPVSGTMIGNPLDAWQLFYKYSDEEATLKDVLRIVSEENAVHAIIVQFDVIRFMLNMWRDQFDKYFAGVAERLLEGCRYARDKKGKPVFLSMFLDPYSDMDLERKHTLAFKRRCESEGFPVFPALRDAVRTAGRIYDYTQMTQRKGPGAG
jgi:acyl-CoA synthetase (NDP forming)